MLHIIIYVDIGPLFLYAISFNIAYYFDITYLRAFFMCIAKYRTILNPAISPNHWANLDETWQGCSLGEALQKLFKEFNSIHNSGCHGNQKEKKCKIFENLL